MQKIKFNKNKTIQHIDWFGSTHLIFWYVPHPLFLVYPYNPAVLENDIIWKN